MLLVVEVVVAVAPALGCKVRAALKQLVWPANTGRQHVHGCGVQGLQLMTARSPIRSVGRRQVERAGGRWKEQAAG